MTSKHQFGGKKVRLGDVATYINGYAFKPSDYAEAGKPIIRIQDLTGNAYQTNRYSGELMDRYAVTKGDVLISWSASLGVFEWSGEDAWLNQHIFKVVFDKMPIERRYFIHHACYVIKKSSSLAHGATMRHLTKKVFENLPFFYPNLSDQTRIAKRLDLIQKQISNLNILLKKLDSLIKSRFVEMFKVNHYEKLQLSEIGKLQSGGTPARSCTSYFEGDIDWYSAGELNQFKLAGSKEKITQKAIKESSAKLFPAGSLLIGMYDTAALKMGSIEKPSSSNQACACFTPHTDMELIWLFYEIDYQKPKLLARRNGCRQKNFNLGFIKSIEVEFPPLSLQQEFVVFVHQVDKLKFDFDFLVSFSIPSICLFCLKLDP